MEAVLVLVSLAVVGVGTHVVRMLRDDFRYSLPRRMRGSQARLVDPLPPGTEGAWPARVADLRPGDHVAVIGDVVGNATQVAPMSRRLCMASDVALYDHVTGDLVIRTLQSSVFAIKDRDGRHLTIDARGAYLRTPFDHKLEAIGRERLDEKLRAQVPDLLLDVYEGAVLPGTTVLVIGQVQAAEDSPETAYRRGADPRIRIAPCPEHPVLVSASYDEDFGPYWATIRRPSEA